MSLFKRIENIIKSNINHKEEVNIDIDINSSFWTANSNPVSFNLKPTSCYSRI